MAPSARPVTGWSNATTKRGSTAATCTTGAAVGTGALVAIMISAGVGTAATLGALRRRPTRPAIASKAKMQIAAAIGVGRSYQWARGLLRFVVVTSHPLLESDHRLQ